MRSDNDELLKMLLNPRAKKSADPFLETSQMIESKTKTFNWKVYAFVPLLVCLVFTGVFMFSPVSDWLVSQSTIFNFLIFDDSRIGGANLISVFIVTWSSTAITIAIINILLEKDIREQGANPFTYINSKLYAQFVGSVYNRPVASRDVQIERKRYDESQAYQYTGRPSRRKAKPSQPQTDMNEKIDPVQCSNFDLPEFDPDGPDPFAREDE